MELKLADLKLDFTLYPRGGLDDMNVGRLVDALRAGASFPPIVADRASHRVADGFHRIAATRRFCGDDAGIAVELRDYADEAALYEDAVRLNATHGQPLTSFDHARIIARAGELGLAAERITGALTISRERYDRIVRDKLAQVNGRNVPLKRTLAHCAGRELSLDEQQCNASAGGMNQLFYVNQVVALLKHGAVDLANKPLVARLRELRSLLKAFK